MNSGAKAALKGLLRAVVLPIARTAARNARMKQLARALLRHAPALERQVRTLLARPEPLPPRRMHVPMDANDLSPAAQALYQELKHHFETRKS